VLRKKFYSKFVYNTTRTIIQNILTIIIIIIIIIIHSFIVSYRREYARLRDTETKIRGLGDTPNLSERRSPVLLTTPDYLIRTVFVSSPEPYSFPGPNLTAPYSATRAPGSVTVPGNGRRVWKPVFGSSFRRRCRKIKIRQLPKRRDRAVNTIIAYPIYTSSAEPAVVNI